MSLPVPLRCGIGLRHPHYAEVLAEHPQLGWIEVHSENFIAGGQPLAMLHTLAEHYPLSLHGVGLGLGSAAEPDPAHLAAIAALHRDISPALVSEHLSFNHDITQRFANDLLPIPYTRELLAQVGRNIDAVQQALQRPILIENLSSYLAYPHNEMSEAEFLAELHRQTGCGLLLDINNLYVNHINLGEDCSAFLAALPAEAIGEIHLAGYSTRQFADGSQLLVDTHSQAVHEGVWALYREAIARFGPRPTLIEWDIDIPPLAVLQAEAAKANQIMEVCDV